MTLSRPNKPKKIAINIFYTINDKSKDNDRSEKKSYSDDRLRNFETAKRRRHPSFTPQQREDFEVGHRLNIHQLLYTIVASGLEPESMISATVVIIIMEFKIMSTGYIVDASDAHKDKICGLKIPS
ncbi:hypothetical protein TNCV_3555801 [Trichonephila clavipes]|nr:hypothetical protein TNCV_3555801 [Trichonephila clavipes]